MKVLKLIAACAAIMVATTSCEHKDLCYNHPHNGRVNVIFDWRYAPDANPESMYLFLYPKDGGSYQQFEFAGRSGGEIEVLEGEYEFLCINSDTRKIRYEFGDGATFNGNLFNFFEVTTPETTLLESMESVTKGEQAPRAEGTEAESIAYEPDPIWTDAEAYTIESIKVVDSQTIILYPRQAYCNYTVKLLNIANAGMLSEMSATLSGMAGGLYVAQRTPTDDAVTIPFGVSFDSSSATGEGTLLTFGHCPEGTEHTHTAVIYAVMSDGAKYYYTVDVTDQIHNAPDPYNVEIVIDNVPLPDPITVGNSGIVVSTWNNIVIELPMTQTKQP